MVVLPHPLGPISPTMLPSAMSRSRSLTTRSSSNDLLNPLHDTATSPTLSTPEPPWHPSRIRVTR